MANWSASDIPDQGGRSYVITGANSGLGAAAAQVLIAKGAQVVLACRDVDKATALTRALGVRADVQPLDLSDLSSVRACAERIESVDVLINNAGVMAVPFGRTADGFEMQFGTNHLGHFALTGLLFPRIRERVVTVSSSMHYVGRINLDDPNYEHRRYERWAAYGQSKLANLMFGKELARRLSTSGSAVISTMAHPGYAATNLQFHTAARWMNLLMRLGNNLVAQDAANGALPELYAATSPDAANGFFYGPKDLGGVRGAPTVSRYAAKADDPVAARRLWELSTELTGVEFGL